ncbi:hypothetical protein [Butyrivibrio sp. NC2007]|uniref:hypothetical protein n=1 Tax=Butyrivibrio sp. NC2007 TaxID=1280683 RepID=UPI0012DF8AE7|nr:hypothetical protein [Butyrivibrio sp. NC2007]
MTKTVAALKTNPEAKQSVLYIYSDAPAKESDAEDVETVRKYICDLDGFKEVIVTERESNWGIEKSVVDGVSYVIKKHGKVIVIEDDLQVCNQFLYYMNTCLNEYEDEKKVYSITGYSFFRSIAENDGVYGYTRSFCSWGWATWLDRWQNLKRIIDKRDVRLVMGNKAALDNGQDFSYLFMHQYKNGGVTWDVAWYFTCFANKGLTIFPYNTMVNNLGMDGSGVHYNDPNGRNRVESINDRKKVTFPLSFVSLEKSTKDTINHSTAWKNRTFSKKAKMFVRFWLNSIEILVAGKKSVGIR